MMKPLNCTLSGAVASSVLALANLAGLPEHEIRLPLQPGQPSQAPRPANPSPRPTPPPSNTPSQPQPSQPQPLEPQPLQPQPLQPQPLQPTNTPPQPGDKTVQPADSLRPGDALENQRNTNTNAARRLRPFALQSPDDEVRFNESTRKLVAMEQKLDRTNQDLLSRLGEVRTMSPERQNAAMFDLLQQVLLHNKATQQYLVQARTAWGGDFESDEPMTDQNTIGTQSNVPTETPAQTNQPR